MSLATLARYWHTLRHLRPIQFYGRVWFRLARPRPDSRAAPMLRAHVCTWRKCERAACMIGETTFRFLGIERSLTASTDWNRSDWPKLWLYNAHYFDDLAASDAQVRTHWHDALIKRWVAENAPGFGNGWEPYPISLRMVNWVKWALAGNALDDVVRLNLAMQARFLRKRLEIHLLGNHLWANAKALIFAGAFFDGDEAAAWRAKGLALLGRELDEQVLPDGGHFERSPMYHSIALEDVLDLVQLACVYPGLFPHAVLARWREVAARMLRWLKVMSHPDGEIAFFNDAALDIAPNFANLASYARSLDIENADDALADIEPLADSGYVRLQSGLAVVIADVAPIGPDYLPGHAHADTLSFELSLGLHRVLVNGGTSTYEAGTERQRQRGTAMHNTVVVDDSDSSEVWSRFRVARRARPFDVKWGQQGDVLWVEAAHDGYRRLTGKVVHRRRWELRSQSLRLTDKLTGRFDEAAANFRFAPGLVPMPNGEVVGIVAVDGHPLRWRVLDEGNAIVAADTWHPRFGSSEACQVLTLSFESSTLQTEFAWT